MRTAEILNRYANGERNFRGADLRGLNLRNQDLSGADFSRADIRGANFRGANLTGAKFVDVQKSGLNRLWILIHLLEGIVLAGLNSYLLANCLIITSRALSPFNNSLKIGLAVTFSFILISSCYLLLRIKSKIGQILIKIAKAIIIVATVAVVFAGVLFLLGLVIGSGSPPGNVSQSSAGTVQIAFAVIVAGAVATATAVTVIASIVETTVFALAIAGMVAVAVPNTALLAIASSIITLIAATITGGASGLFITIAIIFAIVQSYTAILIAARALKDDSRYEWIYQITTTWSSIGGTSFRDANLTQVNFRGAHLKNTDLRAENIDQSSLSGTAPQIELSRTPDI